MRSLRSNHGVLVEFSSIFPVPVFFCSWTLPLFFRGRRSCVRSLPASLAVGPAEKGRGQRLRIRRPSHRAAAARRVSLPLLVLGLPPFCSLVLCCCSKWLVAGALLLFQVAGCRCSAAVPVWPDFLPSGVQSRISLSLCSVLSWIFRPDFPA
jgi:hypothetical protein